MADSDDRRLHPRLRVLQNRSDTVNATASLVSSRVVSGFTLDADTMTSAATRAVNAYEAFAQGAVPGADVSRVRRPPKRQKLKETGLARNAYVNVFIEAVQADPDGPSPVVEVTRAVRALLDEAALPPEVPRRVLPRRNFVSATVPVNMLSVIKTLPGVAFVHPAESLSFSLPTAMSPSKTLKPTPRAVSV